MDYYLYEYKNPDGYNLLKEPVKLKFYAEYDATKPGVFANNYPYLTVVGGESTEELAFMVENSAGVELPSTGGIGTTIFYVLGGIMVVGAAVLLITKKRMGAEV